MGRAVTAQAMPMPSTTCHVAASGPAQPGKRSRPRAATAPKASGTTSARPAVTPVSTRLAQAWPRSSSTPATKTKIITAHQATPFSAEITVGENTAACASGNAAPRTPGPKRIPVTICTTTSGAQCSVLSPRHTRYGAANTASMATRNNSVAFMARVPPPACRQRPCRSATGA